MLVGIQHEDRIVYLCLLDICFDQRLERGEMDGEDEMLSPRGEARDDISLLPRKLAIKVSAVVTGRIMVNPVYWED